MVTQGRKDCQTIQRKGERIPPRPEGRGFQCARMIENFKYFIAGLGALPVAILYSFLRLNYKLTSNWIFLLFIALAFLCGHYLWVFAKSFFLKKEISLKED